MAMYARYMYVLINVHMHVQVFMWVAIRNCQHAKSTYISCVHMYIYVCAAICSIVA